jgi:hypothetical protein
LIGKHIMKDLLEVSYSFRPGSRPRPSAREEIV